MNWNISKGKTVLTLFLVGSAILGMGVFLDGKVIPNSKPSDADPGTAALESQPAQPIDPAKPSQITQQLRQAIEAANNSEAEDAARLQDQAVAARLKIEQINRSIREKGGSGQAASGSGKAQEFNQQLNELKARLAELQESE